jgi:hypothetical protein
MRFTALPNFNNPKQGCEVVYFQTKKSQFGYILEGVAMEDVGIILRPFCQFYSH